MRRLKEAFQSAIDGMPLSDSLNILGRMVTEQTVDQIRTAFYLRGYCDTGISASYVAGTIPDPCIKTISLDVMERELERELQYVGKKYGYSSCWTFPICARDYRPLGTFVMYLREFREASGEEVELATMTTQAAALIICRIEETEERARAEHRQQLLIGELSHRVKNTLATVQSMATQTLLGYPNILEFEAKFQARLHALASAHNLLTKSTWEGAYISDILKALLALSEPEERISASGPAAFLDAQSSLSLALVLHELDTNAREFGSLSVPEGMLNVSWIITSEGHKRRIILFWAESDGPPVRKPKKKGFGTKLVNESLRGVAGKTDLRFEPEGVRCSIDLPLGSGPGEGLSRRKGGEW